MAQNRLGTPCDGSGRVLTRERLACILLPFICPFSMCERDVPVLDHMLDLPLHGDAEEHDEVHHQDGPEHRDIESLKEGADRGHKDTLGRRVPEFKLWKPSNEGPELLVLLGRQ